MRGCVAHMTEAVGAPPFTRDILFTIVLLYVVGGVILFVRIGPWEAVRNVVVNGLILLAWLWSARRILHGVPASDPGSMRHPALELAWALSALGMAVGLAAVRYARWANVPSWALPAVMIGAVLALFASQRYSREALGLTWPSKRGWPAPLAIVAINFAAGALFQVLPPAEAEPVPQADLADQITGSWTALILVLTILLGAALPEELLLRVTLRPRLAQFVPLGWAMLIQALLFSAGHLPQKVIGYQEPWILALGYSLTVNNGLIDGYLWWRTRSLPLLILLHLFAYPRFGM